METKITLQRLGYQKKYKYSVPTYYGLPCGKTQPIIQLKSQNGWKSVSFQSLRLSDNQISPMDDVPEFLIYAVANELQKSNQEQDDD